MTPSSEVSQIFDLGRNVGFDDTEETDVVELLHSNEEEMTAKDLVGMTQR